MAFFVAFIKALYNKLRSNKLHSNLSKKTFSKTFKISLITCSFFSCTVSENDTPIKEFTFLQQGKNTIKKPITNFISLKRLLRQERFNTKEIEKLTRDLSSTLSTAEWYDQKARIEIAFADSTGGKYITKAAFYGMGKSIKLNYETAFGNKIESKTNKNNLVVMKGLINSSLERMILNHQDIPFTLRKKVLRFAQEANFTGRSGDRFYCLYDPKDFTILSMVIANDTKKNTAIAFTSKNGNKLFNLDGTALRGEKIMFKRPVNGVVSSKFGMRMHPILKIYRFHYGVDLAPPRGTPIIAAADGVVLLAGRNGAYGNCVKIQHSNNIITLYGHMQSFANDIKIGQHVKAGQVIGRVGSTGLSSGPHLHYEIWKNHVKVDPLKFSAENKQKLRGDELAMFANYAKRLIKYFS